MNKLHFFERVTDYGAEQVLLKSGNKILAWIEPYPNSTPVYNERGKWWYAFGNPNQHHFTSYKVNDKEEGKKVLMEIANAGGLNYE